MRPLAAAGLYLLTLVGGTYLAYQPVFDSGFEVVQAELGDGMLNHYVLEHSWLAVSDPGYVGTLVRPPFFYPDRWAYWYSETLLGAAPLYWCLRLGLPPDLAYPWWMVASSALNFVSCAAVARRLGCSPPAAALGAFVWAFLGVLVGQGMHQQLIPRFWMPPAVYYGWLLGSAPAARPLHRALACLFLQAVTCVYTGWFLAAGLAVFVPAAAAFTPGGLGKLVRFGRREWRAAGVALGGWGAALGAFFLPYLIANPGQGRSYAECVYLTPTPVSWVTPPPGAAWDMVAETFLPEAHFECRLFPGFGVVGLAAAAGYWVWATRRDPLRPPAWGFVAASLVAAGVWGVLALRVDEVSAWHLVRLLPGSGAIRCVSRVCVIVYLFVALGGAVWLTQAVGRFRAGPARAAACAVVFGVIAAEQAGTTPPLMTRAEFYPLVEAHAAALRGAELGYFVPRPWPSQEYEDVFAMWVGLRANVPVVNGYSGRHPHDYPLLAPRNPDAALRKWLTGKYRGRVVVVERGGPGCRREVVIE
jgi:hypothetical protein